MPVVLIVDDSEVDRRLVGGLLPKDLEWLIEFADNGVEALEKMRLSLPDVVITDMLMPEMDGMELVSNISVDYPNIPVILITGPRQRIAGRRGVGEGRDQLRSQAVPGGQAAGDGGASAGGRQGGPQLFAADQLPEEHAVPVCAGQRSGADSAAGGLAAADAGGHALL